MENCRVAKLKGTVSADLEKFEVFTLAVLPNLSATDIDVKNFQGQVITWDGDVTIILTDNTPITSPYTLAVGYLRVSSSTEGGTINIKKKVMVDNNSANTFIRPKMFPKYNNTFNSLALWWVGNLANVRPANTDGFVFKGRFSDFRGFAYWTTIKQIVLTNNELIGDISELPTSSPATLFWVGQNPDITGNVASLGGWTSLTNLNIEYTAVSGTVEELISAQRAAGRTTGSIVISAYKSNVTYNGSTFVSHTFTWDAQGNITVS